MPKAATRSWSASSPRPGFDAGRRVRPVVAGLADGKRSIQGTHLAHAAARLLALTAGVHGHVVISIPPGTGKTLNESPDVGMPRSSRSVPHLSKQWIGESENAWPMAAAIKTDAAHDGPGPIRCSAVSNENEASRRLKTEFLVRLAEGVGFDMRQTRKLIAETPALLGRRPRFVIDTARTGRRRADRPQLVYLRPLAPSRASICAAFIDDTLI